MNTNEYGPSSMKLRIDLKNRLNIARTTISPYYFVDSDVEDPYIARQDCNRRNAVLFPSNKIVVTDHPRIEMSDEEQMVDRSQPEDSRMSFFDFNGSHSCQDLPRVSIERQLDQFQRS